MRLLFIATLIAYAFAVGPLLGTKRGAPPTTASWNYEDQASWGGFCGSTLRQSPINIDTATLVYQPVLTTEINHDPIINATMTFPNQYGPSVQVADTQNTLSWSSAYYPHHGRFIEFHLHAPSEHTIDGRYYPLEIHFVHTAGDALAVFGFVFEQGGHNPWLDQFFNNISERTLNITNLWPVRELGHIAQYPGSLTTPPCDETVTWHVALTPVRASARQLARWTFGITNRDIQPLGSRTVYTNVKPRPSRP